jgi:hypothetical protein
MQSTGGLTRQQRGRYHDDGFVRLPGFASREVCERMLERVIEIARAHAAGEPGAPGLVLPEANLAGSTGDPEDLVSKIFHLHRDGVFADIAGSRGLTDLLAALIGPRIDCFLLVPGLAPGARVLEDELRAREHVQAAVVDGGLGHGQPGADDAPGRLEPEVEAVPRTTRLSTATSPTAAPAPTTATSRSSTTT